MRFSRSTVLLIVGAVTVFALSVILARWRWKAEHASQERSGRIQTRIAMKWVFAGTMAPYFAAQQNGVFEKHNLDVKLLPGGPQAPSVQQVLLGKADFGITGAHELALARSADQPLVAIAVIFKRSPVCLASLATTGIRGPADLRGKTVEMTIGDNAELEYKAMLARNGVPHNSVNTVRWQFHYGGLLTGKTDAAVVYANDQAITLSRQHPISLLCPSQHGVTPYADVLFTTEDLINKQQSWVQAVVFAILEAWDWANQHREQTVDAFLSAPEIAAMHLDRRIQLAVLDTSIKFLVGDTASVMSSEHLPGIGVMETNRWKETIDLLKQFAQVQKLPAPDACFTNRWAGLYDLQAK